MLKKPANSWPVFELPGQLDAEFSVTRCKNGKLQKHIAYNETEGWKAISISAVSKTQPVFITWMRAK